MTQATNVQGRRDTQVVAERRKAAQIHEALAIMLVRYPKWIALLSQPGRLYFAQRATPFNDVDAAHLRNFGMMIDREFGYFFMI